MQLGYSIGSLLQACSVLEAPTDDKSSFTHAVTHVANTSAIASCSTVTSLSQQYEQLYKKALDCLKQTRSYFKGSPYKSCNKRVIKDFFQCVSLITDHRTIDDKVSHLLEAIKSKAGNCGELAQICYALLYHAELKPNYVSLDDLKNNRFNHGLCQIMIEDKEYYVDPWANLLCKKEVYQSQLEQKLVSWNLKEKYVVTPLAVRKLRQYMETRDRKAIEKYEVTIEDLRNLSLVYCGQLDALEPLKDKLFLEQLNALRP